MIHARTSPAGVATPGASSATPRARSVHPRTYAHHRTHSGHQAPRTPTALTVLVSCSTIFFRDHFSLQNVSLRNDEAPVGSADRGLEGRFPEGAAKNSPPESGKGYSVKSISRPNAPVSNARAGPSPLSRRLMTHAHAERRVAETWDLRVLGCIRGAESTRDVGVVKLREDVFWSCLGKCRADVESFSRQPSCGITTIPACSP